MKKILYFIIGTILLTSCEDFLDSSNKTKKDSSNFPQTEADVSQLLTGVYSILGSRRFGNVDRFGIDHQRNFAKHADKVEVEISPQEMSLLLCERLQIHGRQ